jgi:N,N-dimethylformamidase
MPSKGRQAIVAKWVEAHKSGFALTIEASSGLTLALGDGRGRMETLSTGTQLLSRRWYFVAACFDEESREVCVLQEPLVPFLHVNDQAYRVGKVEITPVSGPWPLIMAALSINLRDGNPATAAHYNGKLDSPLLLSRALSLEEMRRLRKTASTEDLSDSVVAAWDFSREMTSTRILDRSRTGLHGRTVNLPARAMTGYNWSGQVMRWADAPQEYGAIHFHDDDLYDANWATDFELKVPYTMKSGVYAARLRAGDMEDYVPFFVRPPRGKANSKVALLLSTATYIAYANDHGTVDGRNAQLMAGRLVELNWQNLYLNDHPELGNSLYDAHTDGSGTCYSSRLRPILNMRPKFTWWAGGIGSSLWGFNADTHITDWLEAMGYSYDVITDEDLHEEGIPLLKPYRVVLTGTHPEYFSTRMWEALHTYLEYGGRMMYLGGNGFYWRIAFHCEIPGAIEVRRAENGIRAWVAQPGEYYHSLNCEYGGLWRNQGRAPQTLCGTGFVAEGFDVSSYFRRQPDSFSPRAKFIFEGIGDDEIIGNFGLQGGGAAGIELDVADLLLGTPPHTLILASSQGHSDTYLLANEEVQMNLPNISGTLNPRVRADMVFFETGNGGAVFSTGSIAWCGSLSHNNYANNVSRITDNVLRRLTSADPL